MSDHCDPLAEPIATPVRLRRPPMPEDRWGCSRDCIDEHDYVWGRCEHATPPPPRLGLMVSETFTAADGCLSVRLRHLTVEEAKQRIAEFEGHRALRDLLRAAYRRGIVLRRLRHGHWRAISPDPHITVEVYDPGHAIGREWGMTVNRWDTHEHVEISGDITVERAATALKLVGWDLGSTT